MDHRGARGAGLALLCVCFGLTLGPGRERTVLPADGPAQVEIEAGPPLVALTFDDGPRNSTTGRLLEGLSLREVSATFFLVGERIAGSEELIQEMAAGGHQIGVHTYDHVCVTDLTRKEFELQLSRTRAQLTHLIGPGDYWLRPPYGITDESTKQWADSPLILWSVDPEDWKDQNADRVTAHILEHVRDGDIILMHDIYDSSVDAALRVVDALQERGFCFVTVSQLMELRGAEPEKGERYTRFPPSSG